MGVQTNEGWDAAGKISSRAGPRPRAGEHLFGQRLTALGQVDSFDQYGLLLAGSAQQFIFKRAISAIVPARDVSPALRS